MSSGSESPIREESMGAVQTGSLQAPLRKQGLGAIDGAMALIVVLLITQIWLLTATLEAYLEGHHDAALPAAIASGILFLICFGLYLFVDRLDTQKPPQ